MTQIAPIILFAYKRADLTKQTLESLMQNDLADRSSLYIFCDGPKINAPTTDLKAIEMVHKVAEEKSWCKKVLINKADQNIGLANSVIGGVSSVLEKHESAIIVEDDVLLSKYFLQFINDALGKYKNERRVGAIGSWNYYTNQNKVKDNYFLRMPDSIGWGVYKRSWEKFEKDAVKIKSELIERNLMHRFNFNGMIPDHERMLNKQIDGTIDSWAIRWCANFILKDWLAFYPRTSISKHVGFNTGATHSISIDYNAKLKLANTSITISDQPIVENDAAMLAYGRFWKRMNSLPVKAINRLMRYVK